jgi:lipoprotein-anchoring transpeptidase ErfK/SrfK
MIALLAAFALALPTVGAQTASEAPAHSPKESLGPLFSKAKDDPAGVVPLILAASDALDPGSKSHLPLDPKEARLLSDTLEPFCRRAFFGPERLPGMESLGLVLHTVSTGEVPEKIAKRYRIGAGMLGYLNAELDPRKLREGQTLKVLDLSSGGLSVFVEKSLYRLAAWRRLDGGRRVLIEYAPVGLGAADSPTPIGKSSIQLRARNPDWTDPVTKQVYKAGDPRNVLGGYWIALDATGLGRAGIGIHGFTGEAPANWIEQPASHGCVRMLQTDVDRLFHLALEGTPVEVEP